MLLFAYVWRNSNSEFEISQSVRLVKKYFPDCKVVVIGDKPSIKGVDEHIQHRQVEPTRFGRMSGSVRKLCTLYDEFVLMYDDIFLNDKYDFIPKNRGELKPYGNTNYQDIITKCKDYLSEKNLPTLNYECHQPELINSKKFNEIFKNINKNTPHFIKTIYFNHLDLDSDTIPNLKVDSHNVIRAKKLWRQHHCFSTGEGLSNEMRAFIRSL